MRDFILPHTGRSIPIPHDAHDWELYTSSMKCGQAARALTAALKKALKVVDAFVATGGIPNEDTLDVLYTKYIRSVAVKYAEFGATDTEPRSEAFRAMERAAQA
jgi:hypothetical protein